MFHGCLAVTKLGEKCSEEKMRLFGPNFYGEKKEFLSSKES
jgi:hypothetical protein